MIPSMMDMDMTVSCVDELFASDPLRWHVAVIQMKNTVIGNNKQKSNLMNLGVVPRLLQFMIDESTSTELRIEAAVILGSLAKGTEENIKGLIEAGAISVLLKDLSHPNLKYVEACLRCLRTCLTSDVAPADIIYQDPTIVPHLINIISKSSCTQECITNIFAHCCRTVDHQTILCSHGAIAALAPLISSNIYRVQMPTLKCLSEMCFQNHQVAMGFALATYNGETLPNLLMKCLARDKPLEMQMSAAKCLTYLCRAGALEAQNPIIMLKTLPALVRMCQKDKTIEERAEGAETLAYLIEVDSELQQTASISDHLITTLAGFFKTPVAPLQLEGIVSPGKKDTIVQSNEMRQAAFRAFASLGANDEEIRKKIIETENLMEHIVNGLSDPVTKVQLAAVRCLHSLSRSVQQLRTSFQDHAVWKPLMKILHSAPEDVLTVASSTLCNLLLEFSPSKEPMLELGAIELLVNLTKRDDPALRLNGIWALMNLAFQAEQKVKGQILNALGTEQLFRLLGDPEVNVLMKTLGLLRNLLSNKPQLAFSGEVGGPLGASQNWSREIKKLTMSLHGMEQSHIDHIMSIHGVEIMQAVILILEGDHPIEVKEQALCILANVADGDSAKDFIMSNEDVLKKLMSYMIHSSVRLQIAATFCISNLVWNEEEGALERQARLRDLGVQKLLQQLLSTNDTTLFDKVKTALQQF